MSYRTNTGNALTGWRTTMAALAVAAIAAAAPALAQAHPGPGDVITHQPQTQYTSAQLNQLDQDGPKNITVHRPSVPSAPTPSSGIDWGTTGAELGGAMFALVLVAGGLVLIKRHRRDAQPERGSLAGA